MARINLLPWREMERARRQREFMVLLAGAATLAALIVVYVHIHINALTSGQAARNSFLEAEIAEVDKRIEAIKDLEATKERLLARMDVIQELQSSRPQVVHLFDELARTVPDGVYLNKIKRAGNRVTIDGSAQSNARVSAYMRNLDASDWLTNPKLSVIKNLKQQRVRLSEFTLDVTQTAGLTAPESEPESVTQ